MSETWIGGNGDWGTAGLWSGDIVPNDAATTATIGNAGTYAVTIAGAESFTAAGATLDNASATLLVATGGALLLAGADPRFALDAGTLQLSGTLADGTLDLTGGTVAYAAGTLADMTIDGELDLATAGAMLTIAGGLTLNSPLAGTPGTIDLSATGAVLAFADNETLTDTVLNLGTSTYFFAATIDLADTLTIDATSTLDIAGPNAYVAFRPTYTTVGGQTVANTTLVNRGLLEISGTNAIANLQLGGFTNSGTVIVGASDDVTLDTGENYNAAQGSFVNTGTIDILTGGYLLINSSVSALTLGTIDEAGGKLVLAGTYDNRGSLITLSATNSFAMVELYQGSVLEGGTIDSAGGTLIYDYGTLSAVTWTGPTFTVGAGGTLFVRNGLTFDGATTLVNNGYVNLNTAETLALGAANPVINDGTLDVEGAVLSIGGSVTGLGVIDIGAGGTVALADAGVGQVVAFIPNLANGTVPGTLLVAGGSFTGVITGFGAGSEIDLAGITATSFGFDADDGLFSLLDGTALVGTLQFGGVDFDPGFDIAPDGDGGLLVTGLETRIWNGAAGADWYDAANWQTPAPYANGVPVAGDAVTIAGTAAISAGDVATFGTLDHELIYLDTYGVTPTLAATGETFGAGITLMARYAADLALAGPSTFAGYVLDKQGALAITDTGILTNTGVILAAEQGTTTITAPTLVNDGAIDAGREGAVTLAVGVVLGTGAIDLGGSESQFFSYGASRLVIPSGVTVASTQILDFNNAEGNELFLTLAHPDDFAAEIVGFVAGDTIAIAIAGAAGGSETYDATSGDLSVYAANAATPTAVLNVGTGNLASNFSLTTSGTTALLLTDRQTSDGGDVALQGDQARSQYAVDGTGITIGVISDSFNVTHGMAADIADGDLPANVDILQDGVYGDTDEGRSMAELIHRIAPGATIDFYTGIDNQNDDANAGLATAVNALTAAGANIIVDDLSFGDEPFFQTGSPADDAIQAAIAQGVDYFTSAGNQSRLYFQGSFSAIATTLPGFATQVEANDFGGGNPLQAIAVDAGSYLDFELQWDQPFASIGGSAGSQNNLSMYLFNDTGTLVASATASALNADPIQTLYFDNAEGPTGIFRLAIVWDAGSTAPDLFKYVNETDGVGGVTIDDANADQGSGTDSGHEILPGVNTVGAVDYVQTPAFGVSPAQLEDFSDVGPGEILFGPDGERLATPETVGAPEFVSVDGPATDPLSPFYGTSAAAPDAAAVAALMLEANPNLTTAQITVLLEQSAISLDLPAAAQGAGLIQAPAAVALAENAACYLAGTRIAVAPSRDVAEVPIEDLRIGDQVRTAAGGLRGIRWIGRRSYQGRFAGDRIRPILIRRDALADGMPHRDLYVSPLHALYLDDVLIPAELLVNGVSVLHCAEVRDIVYFHIELDTHDILLADGAPAESFVDCDSRGMFHNAHEFAALYPDDRSPKWAFCAPRVEDGPILAGVRRRTAARAGLAGEHVGDAAMPGPLHGRIDVFDHRVVSGWAFDPARPHTALRLTVVIDGVEVGTVVANELREDLRVAGKAAGRCAFAWQMPIELSCRQDHQVELRRDDGVSLARALAADPDRPGRLEGQVDTCTPTLVEGWALDADRPTVPVRVEVTDGLRIIGYGLADQYRADLEAAGKGCGYCRFVIRLEPDTARHHPDGIRVRRASDGKQLAA